MEACFNPQNLTHRIYDEDHLDKGWFPHTFTTPRELHRNMSSKMIFSKKKGSSRQKLQRSESRDKEIKNDNDGQSVNGSTELTRQSSNANFSRRPASTGRPRGPSRGTSRQKLQRSNSRGPSRDTSRQKLQRSNSRGREIKNDTNISRGTSRQRLQRSNSRGKEIKNDTNISNRPASTGRPRERQKPQRSESVGLV